MGSGIPREEIREEMRDQLRAYLAGRGVMTLPDLVDAARVRNPQLKIRTEQEEIGRLDAHTWTVTVVRVTTDRGVITHRRYSSERWIDTFTRAGLI